MWLEGADASGRIDAFDDIDLVVDVEDEEEEQVLEDAEAALAKLGHIDLSLELELADAKLRHKVFHLEGSSEFLLVDSVVQSHSRAFRFLRENGYERPHSCSTRPMSWRSSISINRRSSPKPARASLHLRLRSACRAA
jgi:hypothetical protein